MTLHRLHASFGRMVSINLKAAFLPAHYWEFLSNGQVVMI
ncbi:hypothetical protein Ec53638_A0391 (plasmid) [Escherichia coli 53638]|nr:hypothetical protein Ec53638_A0391 [Escherichia coli 53638]